MPGLNQESSCNVCPDGGLKKDVHLLVTTSLYWLTVYYGVLRWSDTNIQVQLQAQMSVKLKIGLESLYTDDCLVT